MELQPSFPELSLVVELVLAWRLGCHHINQLLRTTLEVSLSQLAANPQREAAQREATSMLEAEEYAASPMNAEMQVDPLALDFQAGRLGRLRCPVTVVSRNSCKTSIFLPSTRRNQGNGVNH